MQIIQFPEVLLPSSLPRLPVQVFVLAIAYLLSGYQSQSQPVISERISIKALGSGIGSDSITVTTAKPPVQNRVRTWAVAGGHLALWAGSYIALSKVWYADYPKSGFHFFNDNREWNQMDKIGHMWTAYQMARHSAQAWKWAGMNHRTSTWLGGISGIAYQSIIEIQDGYSAEWGFSWGDMLANLGGAAAYLSQELGWKEQRIKIKLSYWPYDYPGDLISRRNQLFGKSLPERILKDYNSQTYWISANLKSFLNGSRLPQWLNFSFGYGSEGMMGGFNNQWKDGNGQLVDRSDIKRIRRFFLSPDLDLTRIKTRSRLLKSVFFVLNMVKIPAPALELNSSGKFRLHALYF